MGFLSGSVTLECFRVDGEKPRQFGPEHVKILERFAIGQIETSSPEQADVGFLAGGHLFDLDFDLEKNVIGEALHCAVRIDTNQIPAAVRKAWLQIELAALTADNPSGRPTKAPASGGEGSRRGALRRGSQERQVSPDAAVPRAVGCQAGHPVLRRDKCRGRRTMLRPVLPERSSSSWGGLPRAVAPRSGRPKPNVARRWKK